MRPHRKFGSSLAGPALAILLFLQTPLLSAQGRPQGPFISPRVNAVKPDTSQAGNRAVPSGRPANIDNERPVTPRSVRPNRPATPGVQLGAKSFNDAPGINELSNTLVNVAGLNGFLPPDTVGDVGPNHYVQMINSTPVRITNKQGALTAGQIGSLAGLWPASDTTCGANDDGDPIVVYDHLADRWLISQFAAASFNPTVAPFAMCIAISQTPDPTAGTWNLYTISMPVFPDYPKFGVWPDGYYMTSYEGSNLGVYVFDRAAMLQGAATGFIKYTISSLGAPGVRDTRILPADLDGPPPPNGTPNYLVHSVDDQQDPGDANDRLDIYEFSVNWAAATSSFSLVQSVRAAQSLLAFDTMTCDRYSTGLTNAFRDCIPVPGAGSVDALSNRPMMQLKFRMLNGTTPTMVFNQTIDVQGTVGTLPGLTVTNEVAGIRWYDLRKPAASWSINDQGTFAPQPLGISQEANVVHRWMGSMAMDKMGNIALGYSFTDDSATNPGIRYTGRAAGDIPGVMPQGEKLILTGPSSPGGTGTRWGDYSAMSVDPVDDCTFWFTTHVDAGATRIASFRFPSCNSIDLSVTKTDSPDPVIAGNILDYTITVLNSGTAAATNVKVVDTLPAGVTFLSSSIPCPVVGPARECTIASLGPNASVQISLQVRIPANFLSALGVSTANITNTVSLTLAPGEIDTNPANNTATATTQVIEQADVRITKTCKPDNPAPAGSAGFCDLVVTNLGVSDARNVSVVDTITSNAPFQVVSYTVTPPVVCAPAVPSAFVTSFTATCTVGTLAAGASTTIRVNITANGAADVNDTATVSSATPDPDLTNNVATGQVVFTASANLGITKSAAPNPVVAGENLTYTITITNAGPSSATNVVVADTIPGQTSIVSVTPGGGFQCQGGIPGNPAQPLTCGLGAVPFPAGGSASITVVVKVASSVPDGTILINNASVSSQTTDPNNSNNLATANAPVVTRANLGIVKTSDLPVYKPSSQVIYTITVSNAGSSDAQAVVVTDDLPLPKQALYLSDNGGCTLIAGKTLNCALGTMAVGSSRSFQVYMVVKGSRGDIDNTAVVTSATTDPSPGNNSSTRTVTIGK